VAKLPPGSKRDNRDAYAGKGFPWMRILVVSVILIGGYQRYRGALDRFLRYPFAPSPSSAGRRTKRPSSSKRAPPALPMV
jgi:hypothetical protein